MESIIIEALFLDSLDAQFINIDKIAQAICDNIVSFYNLQPKIVPVVPKPVSNILYRIIAGSYSTPEEAIKASEKLKAIGVDNWISQYKK